MERREYLERLDHTLRALTGSRERQDILDYYQEYLEEAGPDRAQAAMATLGKPEGLARASVEQPSEDAPRPPRPRRVWKPSAEGDTYRCPAALVGLRFDSVRVDVLGAGMRLERGETFLVRLDAANGLVTVTAPAALEEVQLMRRSPPGRRISLPPVLQGWKKPSAPSESPSRP